jgi:hypothetical protein
MHFFGADEALGRDEFETKRHFLLLLPLPAEREGVGGSFWEGDEA